MPAIMRKFEWDAGHRLINHEGKCKYLHGHRYVAELVVVGKLDALGRVIDFGCLKEMVGRWIDDNWDHNMLLNSQDSLIGAIRQLNKVDPINHEAAGWEDIVFHAKSPYILKDANPTAENIAKELFLKSQQILKTRDIDVLKVRVWETPNCWAQFGQKDFNRATAKSAAGRKGS